MFIKEIIVSGERIEFRNVRNVYKIEIINKSVFMDIV